MILRPYKKNDNPYIFDILPKDEKGFFMWCAGKLIFPLDENDFNKHMDIIENSLDVFSLTCVDGKPIGSMTFTLYDERVHFGFVVCERGRGKEMLQLAINYSFHTLNKNKITLKVYKDNPRAINCYKKVGFIFEKEYDNHYDMAIIKE